MTTVQVAIGATSSDTMGSLLSAMQANGVAASISSSGQITVSGGGVTAADAAAAAAAGVTTGTVSTATATTPIPSLTTASTGTSVAVGASDNAVAGDTFTFTPPTGTATTFQFIAAAGDTTTGGAVGVIVRNAGTGAGTSEGDLVAAMQAAGISATTTANGLKVTGGTLTAGAGNAVTATSYGAPVSGTLAAAATAGTGASAIAAVNSAIATIGATLSQLGAASIQLQGLTDFTIQLSDSVTTGLGAMVDANLSAESAQLSSLQTKQSLAIQSLTLANQGPSSLLQLFR